MNKFNFYKAAIVALFVLIVAIYIDYRDTNRYIPSPIAKNVVIDTKTGDIYLFDINGAKKIGIKK